jgi:hypothetical protein
MKNPRIKKKRTNYVIGGYTMKIAQKKLQRIIREEVYNLFKEQSDELEGTEDYDCMQGCDCPGDPWHGQSEKCTAEFFKAVKLAKKLKKKPAQDKLKKKPAKDAKKPKP